MPGAGAGPRGLGQHGSCPAIGLSLLPPATMASTVHGPGLVQLPLSQASIPLGCVAGMHSLRGQHGCQFRCRWDPRGSAGGGCAIPTPPWPPQAWAAACHFLGGHGCGGGCAALLPARCCGWSCSSVTCISRFLQQHRCELGATAAPAASVTAPREPPAWHGHVPPSG